MDNVKNNIQFYIPERITKLLAENKSRLAQNEKLRGGILFFDLVKFTSLTVLLSESGPRGAEKLHELMTGYFDLMIDIIHRFGGTIYQFAGDSAIAAFEEKEGGETDTIGAMCACALQMKRALQNADLRYKDHKLGAKFALSYGEFHQALLGDEASYFLTTLLGAAIDRVIKAEAVAREGEIIIAPEVALAIRDYAEIGGENAALRLEKLNKTVEEKSVTPAMPENEASLVKKYSRFIHPLLIEKITTSQLDYIGEFRDVTTVFIQPEGIDFSGDLKTPVDNLNKIYIYIRELCDTFGGTLIQGDFTDKGCVFLVLFGAPVALEKKEIMAVRFALRLQEIREKFPFIRSFNIGIAGGPIYCGDVGSKLRKGYSVLGESVNLASRLMAYSSGAPVSIDQKTAKALPDTFLLERKTGVQLKGIAGGAVCYTVKGENKAKENKSDQNVLLGRKKDLAALKGHLNEAGENTIAVSVIGVAGVGKSTLVLNFLQTAREESFELFPGICYSYEKFTPYFPWKSILSRIFQISEDSSAETALELIEGLLESFENHKAGENVSEAWAKVFYRLIGGSVEETKYTMNMEPKKKNEHIFNMIKSIIIQKSSKKKMLFLFEDYHWIDEGSENLVRFILESGAPGVMFLLVSRPEGPIYNLDSHNRYRPLVLKEFSDEDSLEYIRGKMNLRQLDGDSAKLEREILTKGHGNPFFLESIVYSLREHGVLTMGEDGKYIFSGKNHEIEIPDSIQGVLLSRIDRLSESEKLILKNASVIGRLFAYNLLKYIAPIEMKSTLSSHLANLESNDFTLLESEDPLLYLFKHILIRDVAYHSLLSSTRQTLHNSIATYLENLGEERIQENIEQLAYHFFQAKNIEKAIKYSVAAARNATSNFSIADAIYHYENVLNLLQESNGKNDLIYDVKIELGHVYRHGGMFAEAIDIFQEPLEMVKDRERLVRIHMGMGQVYQEQGDSAPAMDELEKALELLGSKVPKNRLMATLGTLKELINQGIFSIVPFLPLKVTGKKAKILETRYTILEYLAKIYFFLDVEKYGWAILKQVNIADRVDNDSFKGRAYASLSLIYGALGLYSLAEKNVLKSEEYVKKSKDPLTKAIMLTRTGSIGMYNNNPSLWQEKLTQAVALHEQTGETWEKHLAIGVIPTTLIYLGKMKESQKINKEVHLTASHENIKQIQAWGLSFEGYSEYILNVSPPEVCMSNVKKSIELSSNAKDNVACSVAKRYILFILLGERKAEEALKYAIQFFADLNAFTSIVPHAHVGYFHIIETMELALSKNLISEKEAGRIWDASLKKLKKLGKKYYLITGYAVRAEAKTFAFKGDVKAAQAKISEAINLYAESQNEYERTMTFYDAAVLIPEKRAEYIEKGLALCKTNEYARDLIRFQRLRDSG